MDLADSYDDEQVPTDPAEKARNGGAFPQYEDSDEESGELREGQLNSD